jgi:hypothetical protein
MHRCGSPKNRSAFPSVGMKQRENHWKHFHEIFAVLGLYALLIGSSIPMFRDNLSVPFQSWTTWTSKMGQIDCPETSVSNYQCAFRKIPEDRRSHLHHGGRRKSHIFMKFCSGEYCPKLSSHFDSYRSVSTTTWQVNNATIGGEI